MIEGGKVLVFHKENMIDYLNPGLEKLRYQHE